MRKVLFLLVAAVILSGCVSSHELMIERKKVLCVQFGMNYAEFQFPGMGESDVICRNPDTGELVYMEIIPENKVRPSLY